jgi:hypothetical protein
MERAPLSQEPVPWQGPVDLSRVVRDVVARSAPEMPARVRVVPCLAPDLPWLEGDGRRLGALVEALIADAAERLGAAGGWIHAETRSCALGAAFLARGRGAEGLEPGAFVCLRVTAGATRPSATGGAFELRDRPTANDALVALVRSYGGVIAEEARREGACRITVALPPVGRRRAERMARVRDVAGPAGLAAHP